MITSAAFISAAVITALAISETFSERTAIIVFICLIFLLIHMLGVTWLTAGLGVCLAVIIGAILITK